jgi:hypothetical protein
MKRAAAKKRYTARDVRAVTDNPEWTRDDLAKAKAFDDVFPAMRKSRGTKVAKRKHSVATG